MLVNWGGEGLEDRWADGNMVRSGWRWANSLNFAGDMDSYHFSSLLNDESVRDGRASRESNHYLGYRDAGTPNRWQPRYVTHFGHLGHFL